MFYDHNLTITDVVAGRFYGQDRAAGRRRVARQNRAAKREAHARTEPWFLPAAAHEAFRSQLRRLRYGGAESLNCDANLDQALALLAKAERSYRRAGHVVLMLAQRDAVLLGNVLRRLDGPLPGLDRLDAIAGRSDQGDR